ncbi:AMP-binding protein [Pseudomonas sp. BN414]|uniref:AMP-binding protein n=1 Tax=unclassified Pseudomonas TaxID=196821 RepID=UPI002456CA4D|nr:MULTISPECIES: AMP-binding protein [unclassified Pseudomonas]MDH4565460.1 AMP-binding protein [Pseudomonas sp. BN414]MDH4874478.1 AMP-binding protein [Pseudomonas sp. BN515]
MKKSYTRGTQDQPLLCQTIGEAFDEAIVRYGNRPALVSARQGLRYSWKELGEVVEICARAFLALGIGRGERIGIWSTNCAEWTVVQLASAKVGAVLVNINPAYRRSELEYVLAQSGCCWVICSDSFKSTNYHEIVRAVVPSIVSSSPGNLNVGEFPQLRGVITLADEAPEGFLPWAALAGLAEHIGSDLLRQRELTLQFDDPINIQYTSGTTGFPKGATLSHYNILNNGYMVGARLGLTQQDKLVIPVPLYHCFGMVMGNLACLTHGATMLYPGPSFEPDATLRMVAEERATVLYGVPTMFIALLDHPARAQVDLSSLRTGIMAGATCPIDVMRRVIGELHMTQVQIAYGMTETSPVSLQTHSDDDLELRVTTVGTTQPHLETKIVDTEGRILPRGIVGELCTRGYSVMLGYWNNPQATQEAIDSAGWMHTGDLAEMDDAGYVRIVGRSKDMIIRGGENIYPREIEELLYRHPAIADAQVIGIPDSRYGEEVVAWIKLRSGQTLNEELLRTYCKENISHFKVPRHFTFVDEFPMTVTGKVQKFRMREISFAEINKISDSH